MILLPCLSIPLNNQKRKVHLECFAYIKASIIYLEIERQFRVSFRDCEIVIGGGVVKQEEG